MADPLFFTVIGIVGTAAFIAKAGRKGSEPNAKWIKFFEHFAYMGLIWIGFLLIATRIEF